MPVVAYERENCEFFFLFKAFVLEIYSEHNCSAKLICVTEAIPTSGVRFAKLVNPTSLMEVAKFNMENLKD